MSDVIGFHDDDEHVLCERCSKDTLCCEKAQVECQECGGEGGAEDDSDWQDGPDFPWRDCDTCGGRGWWWYCACDANGQHEGKAERGERRP